mmetsp:Transcript_744/g.1148  ORF Transcript_744/g.1148 Transcript_744/m.1148 type:complete len:1025 (-) Transcript_744:22-3096(-)
MGKGDNVRVVIRFRPLNQREKTEEVGYTFEQEYVNENKTVKLSSSSAMLPNKTFNFDHCFGPDTQQDNFYDIVGKPVLEEVFKGYNGTIFAYGQTGAGKSFSMMGALHNKSLQGVIPRCAESIFKKIDSSPRTVSFKVTVSYLEIYNESIQCLFNTNLKNLSVREDPSKGIYVQDLTEYIVNGPDDIYHYLDVGANNRVVASTKMNAVSSRSHSVFIIRVLQNDAATGTVRQGSLNLVDLAGSEKVGKTGATGQTLEEAKRINASLSALGQCINALVEKKKHIPFRNSKLTRILQQSLGGNSKTTMICACSPAPFNAEETISTLNFGQRAKSIKCRVKLNQIRSPAQLQRIIDSLRDKLRKLKRSNKEYRKLIEEYRKKLGLPAEFSEAERKKLEGDDDEDEEQADDDEDEEDTSSSEQKEGENNNPALVAKREKDTEAEMEIAELNIKLEQAAADHQSEMDKMLDDFAAIDEERATLESQAAKLKTINAENEEALEELLEENDKLLAEKDALVKKMKYDREECDLELEELLAQLDDVEAENKEMKAKLESINKRIEEAGGDLSALESTSSSNNSGDSNDSISNMSSQDRGKLLAELDQLRAEVSSQRRLIDKHNDNMSILESELEEAKNQRNDMEDAKNAVENASKQKEEKYGDQLRDLRKTNTSLRKERSSQIQRGDDLEAEMEKLQSKFKALERKNKRLATQVSTMHTDISERDTKLMDNYVRASSDASLSTAEEHILDQYKQSLKEVQDSLEARDAMSKKVQDDLESKIGDLKRELKLAHIKLVDQYHVYQEEEQTHKELVQDLKKDLEDSNATMDDLKKQLEEQRERANKAEVAYKTVEAQNSGADARFKQLQEAHDEQIAELKLENEELTIQREKLTEQLDQSSNTSGSSSVGSPGNFKGSFGKLVNELYDLRSKYRRCDVERTQLLSEANHQRKVIASERKKVKAAAKRNELQHKRLVDLNDALSKAQSKENVTKALHLKFKTREDELLERISQLEAALRAREKVEESERRKRLFQD